MCTRWIPLFILLSAGTSAAEAPDRAVGKESVALLPLVGNGLAADELARTERIIRAEVDARFGKRSLKDSLVRSRLDAGSDAGLRCDRSSVQCLVQVGVVTQTELVLLASMVPAGESANLSFRLVSVVEGQQIAYAATAVSASPLPEEVSALLAALDQPASRALRLDVKGPAGAPLFVDGVERGALPASLTDVALGKHEVRVDVVGAPFLASVELRPGEPVELFVPDPAPAPAPAPAVIATAPPPPTEPAPASSSLSLATISAGGAVALAGVVALAVGVAPAISYEGHAAELERLDNEIGTNGELLAAKQGEIEQTRALLDADEEAWNGYGMVTAIAGASALAIGIGVAVAGALLVE